MNHERTGKWSYSHDGGEHYYGEFNSFDEARDEALDGHERAFIGECLKPDVLGAVDGECLVDHIQCQDDFCIDVAEGMLDCDRRQKDDLDEMLRETFRRWLDKHDLWPTFYIIEDPVEVFAEENGSE